MRPRISRAGTLPSWSPWNGSDHAGRKSVIGDAATVASATISLSSARTRRTRRFVRRAQLTERGGDAGELGILVGQSGHRSPERGGQLWIALGDGIGDRVEQQLRGAAHLVDRRQQVAELIGERGCEHQRVATGKRTVEHRQDTDDDAARSGHRHDEQGGGHVARPLGHIAGEAGIVGGPVDGE